MRQCVGLPAQPPLRTEDPRLLFINRRHSGMPSCLSKVCTQLTVSSAECLNHSHMQRGGLS